MTDRRASSTTCAAMIDRKILRRVAAILFHRRAGFSANGMGVWKVDPTPTSRTPAGGWPRSAASPTATSARPTRTGPTPSSRWPTAARRRSATRSSQSIADEHDLHGDDRAVLYSSTEFKKVRLRYFTADYAAWEREHAPEAFDAAADCSGRALPRERSDGALRAALRLMPGGVNSPVRAMGSIGRDPIFVERGRGLRVIDVDGNALRRLGLLLGTADPRPRRPRASSRRSADAAARGTSFGAATEGEVELAAEVADRFASVEMVRMVNSGTEAAMSAIRLARAATGRERLIKFAGAYHGHVDGLLAEAGSGLATQAIPASPGRAARRRPRRPSIVPWNDRDRGRAGGRHVRAGGDPLRADPGEHGRGPAAPRASSSTCASSPTRTARCSSATR